MKYEDFMKSIVISDALLDRFDKDEVTVTCNKVEDVPCLIFKCEDEIVNVIILR